ncbi:MAG: acyl-CoA dehydrogenase [Thiomonas sp. 15-63-373]|nr:MAG: acyl-CoA dehydrogenase [Thiomonas sp. 15-63-373]
MQRDYSFEQRRALAAGAGFSPQSWALLAELGITALLVPETFGGLGASVQDGLHALQTLAPALPLEPVVASSLLATHLLSGCSETAAARAWLPRMAEGRAIATPAHFEAEHGFATEQPQTQARHDGDGWLLHGAKSLVLQAQFADVLLVSATAGDGQMAWLAVEPGSDRPGQGAALYGAMRDVWLAALCAEAVGILQATLDATVTYLNTRQQFGQPIGRFQVLQHRAVRMWMELEQARSMALLAADVCTKGDAVHRTRLLAAAKARVGQACSYVSQQAVQLHGGMGMTDEMQVSHWFKRLTVIELWLHDSDSQLQRYANSLRAA